ncbi:hypothetical protein ES703_62946 [subsurface metagenome]
MQITGEYDKRRFKRLTAKFDLSCFKVGQTAETVYTGRTVNVSPGGLYFETSADTFSTGNLLRIELSIPPKAGQLDYGGRISAFARVLRAETIDPIHDTPHLSYSRYGVALEFCRSPKLST